MKFKKHYDTVIIICDNKKYILKFVRKCNYFDLMIIDKKVEL